MKKKDADMQRTKGELTFPAILPNQPGPPLEPILVKSPRRIDQIKQHVIEKRLERRNRSPLHHQQSRQSVRPGNA